MRENGDEGVSEKASAGMGVGAESYMDKKKKLQQKMWADPVWMF